VDKPIDLFAALSVKETRSWKSGRRKAADRVVIDVKAPELVFNVDEQKIASQIVGAMETLIRDQMMRGLAPSGEPLPAASQATMERRAYREAQGARGGQPSERYKDPDFRSRAVRNYRRRFKAPGAGFFAPGQMVPRGKFGIESGMLAMTAKAVPEGKGKGQGESRWRLFFAAARGNIDGKGGSAVMRVFNRIGLDLSAWARTPQIQAVLRNIQKNIFQHRLGRLLSEVTQAAESVTSLAEGEE